MFGNRKIFYCLLFALAVFGFVWTQPVQAAPCKAKILVSLQNYEAKPLTDVQFRIYEQVRFGNLTVPGKSLVAGTTDQYLGVKEVEFELIEGQGNYALMVENPSVQGADFWYFNGVYVTCGSDITVNQRLDSLRVRTRDAQGVLQKNIRFTVYNQGVNANNQPMVNESLGTFNTNNAGQEIVYLPSKEHSLEGIQYYAFSFRDSFGGEYYKYNIASVSGVVSPLDYNFSNLKVLARDSVTGDPIPNFKIDVYTQTDNDLLGTLLTRISTDDNGVGYLRYPPGKYILQYEEANKSDKSFYNVLINEGKETTTYVDVDRASVGKCGVKSTLDVGLRDWENKIAKNINFSLYQQMIDPDSRPITGSRVAQGRIDANGLGQTVFYPLPAERYVLKACHPNDNYGCFWYYDLHFSCDSELTLDKNVSSVELVLRNSKGALVTGQRFKLYQKEVDLDGNLVVNKNKLITNTTLPGTGKSVFYLAPQDMLQANQEYMIVLDLTGGVQLKAAFKMEESAVTYLEYKISGNQLIRLSKSAVVDTSLTKKLAGRILLQVESRGEAWYVNPANFKRYYLGRPADAFAVMKGLSIGVSNKNLNRIKPNVDLVQGKDSDSDGLPDDLEKGLGTDPYRADSDEDGYSDLEEAKIGYNYQGGGRLPVSSTFSSKQQGKILLQVEGNGEAWYINPLNSQRYYLNRPADAYGIMRELGLGITNADLNKIPVGSF